VNDIGCDRDELLSAVERFIMAVKTLLSAFMGHTQASSNRTKLEDQLSYLTDAEPADPSHAIHTLVSR